MGALRNQGIHFVFVYNKPFKEEHSELGRYFNFKWFKYEKQDCPIDSPKGL